MPKGIPNKRYTPEFKKHVIETMLKEKPSYSETARRFEVNSRIKAKLKGLPPAIHRQHTLSVA